MSFFKKKTLAEMFISTPSPRMFGNPANILSGTWTEQNWLKSRFHFSFAEWKGGPSSFGPLRVVNDDKVQPKRGFGAHPHKNMEIFTYVVSGEITHKDSMGNEESLGRGSIQYISAGSGIMHSEYNSGDVPCRFIQMWASPRSYGLNPRYGSVNMGNNQLPFNEPVQLIDDIKREENTAPTTKAFLHQDLKMSVAHVTTEATYSIPSDRALYVISVEGGGKIKKKGEEEEVELVEGEALMVGGWGGDLVANPKVAGNEEKPWHLVFVDVVL